MSIRIVLLGLLLALQVLAQQYPFLPVPGSPKPVGTLYQDSTSRLWLAAESTAWIFDGARFFPLKDRGLPASAVRDFTEDASGAIWIAADTGIYRYEHGLAQRIGQGNATRVLAPSPDVAFAEIGYGGVGNNAQLLRIVRRQGQWKSDIVLNLGGTGVITLDKAAGSILYAWPGKGWNEVKVADLLAWHGGTLLPVQQHEIPGGAPGNGGVEYMRDSKGCLWLGVQGGNSYNCGDGWHDWSYPHFDLDGNMHEGVNGDRFFWGGSILQMGKPEALHTATAANGLPALLDAIQTRDGTAWLGTQDGLVRFASPFRFEYWTAREGVREPPFSFARASGRVFAGLVDEISVLSADRLRWEHFTDTGGGNVAGLLGNNDDSIFASTMYNGAALYSPSGKELAHTLPKHPINGIRLERGAPGEVWLGGLELGLLHREGKVLKLDTHPLASPEGSHHTIMSIAWEEHMKTLWACYSGGILRRDPAGAWREFTTRDGLPENGCWDLVPLPNGDLWDLLGNKQTMARLRISPDGKVSAHNPTSESPGGDAAGLDRAGRIWVGGGPGTFVASPEQAEAGEWLKLDPTDGFRPDMNNGSFFADSDGSVWFGADNDIAHFIPPDGLVNPKTAPKIFLSAYSWEGGAPQLAEASSEIPHGPKAVAHIGSLQFDRRNALRVRYRILPDRAWHESKSLDIALGSLSSGPHTLEVQSRLFTGPWSQTLIHGFTVLVPWWLTTAMLFVYTATLALTLGVGYTLRRRRIAAEDEMLPDLGDARARAFFPEVQEVAGTVLDSRFDVGELIARGGFANVMDGYDRLEKRRCALKIFRVEVAEREWIRRRFDDEVAALKRVGHPHVVRIYAHGSIPSGAPYLVMEFIEGRDLREVLADGPLPPRTVGLVLKQLADALDSIHAVGIFHRDVKPDNIILRDNGSAGETDAVLIDFSIAIVRNADETLHGLSRAAGTYAYMAPEQAIGHAQPATDVYSLARVTIEMLSAKPLQTLLPNASMDVPGRLRELLAGNPWGLSDQSIEMLADAQEFDPGRRPPSAGIFAAPIVRDLLNARAATASV